METPVASPTVRMVPVAELASTVQVDAAVVCATPSRRVSATVVTCVVSPTRLQDPLLPLATVVDSPPVVDPKVPASLSSAASATVDLRASSLTMDLVPLPLEVISVASAAEEEEEEEVDASPSACATHSREVSVTVVTPANSPTQRMVT